MKLGDCQPGDVVRVSAYDLLRYGTPDDLGKQLPEVQAVIEARDFGAPEKEIEALIDSAVGALVAAARAD
jgi:hypothetical protein